MEETVRFNAGGFRLYGILHRPEQPAPGLPFVLMVVGGPQTRVGSHRSYVQIARQLCQGGAHVLRFDYRGIGDADGDWVGYTCAEASILAALAWIRAAFPGPLGARTVLWALCDGAAACLVFGARLGEGVAGMILCNPYVHNAQNRAETLIKYYYLRRVTEKSFWMKLLSFRFNPFAFLASFAALAKSALSTRRSAEAEAEAGTAAQPHGEGDDPTGFAEDTLQWRMAKGIHAFRKPILFLLSGADITADQFRALLGRHREFHPWFKNGRLAIRPIPGADHTFSNLSHKRMVGAESLAALKTYL